MTKQILLFLVLNVTLISCLQNENLKEEKIIHFANKFEDKQIRDIYDLRDQRNTKGLIALLKNAKPKHKIEILTALGSVQDTLALGACEEILIGDNTIDVKLAADFAVGQIGSPRLNDLLIEHIVTYEEKSKGLEVLFETLGECADERAVIVMSHFNTNDELVKRGIVKGLYRALTRKNIQSYDAAEQIMRIFTSTTDKETREWCSAYFTRMNSKQMVETFNSNIFEHARRDTSELVRANFTNAIAVFSKGNGSATALKKILQNEKSPIVLTNAILATEKVKYNGVIEETISFLTHENPRVSTSAAKVIYGKLGWKTSAEVFRIAKSIQNPNTRALALKAVMQERKKQSDVYNFTKGLYSNSNSIYEQCLLLEALNESYLSKELVKNEWRRNSSIPLKTKAIELLMHNFAIKRHINKSHGVEMTSLISSALNTLDVGQIYTVSQFMQSNKDKFLEYYPSIQLLKEVKNKLKLPLQVEGYIEIEKIIASLQGVTYKNNIIPKSNIGVNWKAIQNIKQNQEAIILTEKGEITIQLKVEEAPATVAMFVDLIKEGFYDSLYFHRVVPSFVVQGGDPRGDGFGGLENTIPSEFSYLKYKVGSLGIASAGKDTESCQFFMTEMPTHHLDGKYTIFAEITEGIDIMRILEYGDQIIKITLK